MFFKDIQNLIIFFIEYWKDFFLEKQMVDGNIGGELCSISFHFMCR